MLLNNILDELLKKHYKFSYDLHCAIFMQKSRTEINYNRRLQKIQNKSKSFQTEFVYDYLFVPWLKL